MKLRRLPLAIAIASMLAPLASHAATDGCTAVKNVEPVTTYVRDVLARADDGLAYAGRGGGGSSGFDAYAPSWMRVISNAAVSLIDARVSLEHAQTLRNQTACLRLDLLLIECKIEEVRDALNQGIKDGSMRKIYRLRALMNFLAERHHAVTVGAHHPYYEDVGWGKRYDFDPPASGFCCEADAEQDGRNVCKASTLQQCGDLPFYKTLDACTDAGCAAPRSGGAKIEDRMCPFSTDYLPAQLTGFGCDEFVMESRTGVESLALEREALVALVKRTGEIQRAARDALGADAVTPESMTFIDERQHRQSAQGCAPKVGVCSSDDNTTCASDGDCQSTKGGVGRCIFEQGVCARNPERSCMRSLDCVETASSASSSTAASESSSASSEAYEDPVTDVCVRGTQPSPAFWELRGPFSLGIDWLRLLPIFNELRGGQGEAREQANMFKLPNEASSASRAIALGSPLEQIIKAGGRAIFRIWNKERGQLEAAAFPLADATIDDGLGPLRQAIARLGTLAAKPSGVRSLASEFAFWLLRSCTDGPCTERLETIIKIALSREQECFPYVTGIFERDSCSEAGEKSRAQKCAEAAGLEDGSVLFPDCGESGEEDS